MKKLLFILAAFLLQLNIVLSKNISVYEKTHLYSNDASYQAIVSDYSDDVVVKASPYSLKHSNVDQTRYTLSVDIIEHIINAEVSIKQSKHVKRIYITKYVGECEINTNYIHSVPIFYNKHTKTLYVNTKLDNIDWATETIAFFKSHLSKDVIKSNLEKSYPHYFGIIEEIIINKPNGDILYLNTLYVKKEDYYRLKIKNTNIYVRFNATPELDNVIVTYKSFTTQEIHNYLHLIFEELNKYSSNMVSNTICKSIYVVNTIISAGDNVGGLYRNDILLAHTADNLFLRLTIHHEMFHHLDFIREFNETSNTLNEIKNNTTSNELFFNGYASKYSETNSEEDGAEIFSHLMMNYKTTYTVLQWMNIYPTSCLSKKINIIINDIQKLDSNMTLSYYNSMF